ncbi:eukaryotic translation initiation factor 2 subunit gamma [Coemansia sp. RSA 2131]|nr:eukaryotic translation initiation factor 2 subunit gamma [Coemansia sp. RSA 2131]
MTNTIDPQPFIEAIENQATINIGIIGHVAHGKSALVRAITGVNTIRFKEERERNITMKIGYADAKLYKCDNAEQMQLVRHVSFVDCPGHDVLMQNMLNGAAVMNAAILLVAANESCPQPQTAEHLAAVETMKLQHIVVVQNKCDLVSEDQVTLSVEQIKAFTDKTSAEDASIVPISAEMGINIDAVVEHLCQNIPVPVGDVVEIRPGLITRDSNMHIRVRPLQTRIVSLCSESNRLQFAVPGGLIGVGTTLDPYLCRDKLVGNILGSPNYMPKVFVELTVHYTLLRRLLGVADVDESKHETYKQDSFGVGRLTKVSKVKKHVLQVNVGACTGMATVGVKDELAKLKLERPACADIGEALALSRKFNGSFRLIGWAKIVKGKALVL